MKGIVAGPWTFAVFALGLSALAEAQDTWRDPSGRFSINFAASGWSEGGGAHGGYTLLLENRQFVEQSGRSRVCAVRQQRQPVAPASADQAALNVVTERLDARALEFIHLGAELTSLSHLHVKHVVVSDYTLTYNERWQRWRTFFLPGTDSPVRVDVGCILVMPISDAERESVSALVESLSFTSPELP